MAARSAPVGEPASATILVELLVHVQALEEELARRRDQGGTLEGTQRDDRLAQARDAADTLEIVDSRHAIRHLDAPAALEVFDHLLQRLEGDGPIEDLQHCAAEQPIDQVALLLLLTGVLEL